MRKVLFYLMTIGVIFFFGLTPNSYGITLADLTMYQMEAEAANYYAYEQTQKAFMEGKIKTDCDADIYYDQKTIENLILNNDIKNTETAQKLQQLVDKVYRKTICNPDGSINLRRRTQLTLELSKYLEKEIRANFNNLKDYNDLIEFVIDRMYKFLKSNYSS